MRATVDCPDIVILNGAQFSNTVKVTEIHEDADDILLLAKAIAGVVTYSIQINTEKDGSGTWLTYNDGTADILPPASGKAGVYPFLNYTFRIAASAAVGSETRWGMKKSFSYSR